MKTRPVLNTPWTLHFDQDGTEDIAIIYDLNMDELATSRHFWLPQRHEDVPPTLAALRVMAVAPQLLAALKTVVTREWERKEESRNFSELFLEHAACIIDQAEGRA